MNKSMFPKKLVMVEQQKPYRKRTFEKFVSGYMMHMENGITVYTTKITEREFIKRVVDLKELENFKVVEIEQ